MEAVQLVKAFCDRLGVKSEAEMEGVFSLWPEGVISRPIRRRVLAFCRIKRNSFPEEGIALAKYMLL
jgi:hypothetical protein